MTRMREIRGSCEERQRRAQPKSLLSERPVHNIRTLSNVRNPEYYNLYMFEISPDKMDAVWEHVYACPLRAGIIDTNFGVWNTTAVARLRIGLILDLPIALEWTCNVQNA